MNTARERIEHVIHELGIKPTDLVRLSGASRSVVSQWMHGRIKSIDARYAFALQKNTGFSSEWIQTGRGQKKVSAEEQERQPLSAEDEAELKQLGLLWIRLTRSQRDSYLQHITADTQENARLLTELQQLASSQALPEDSAGISFGGAGARARKTVITPGKKQSA